MGRAGARDQRLAIPPDRTKPVDQNDDPEYYLRVRKVETSEFTRIYRRLARFTVTFTCTAYQYLVRGGTRVPCPEVVNNQFETAYPIFYITTKYPTGNTATITVNGNAVTIQITTPTTIIDVERRMVYTGDYKIINGNATGELGRPGIGKGCKYDQIWWNKEPCNIGVCAKLEAPMIEVYDKNSFTGEQSLQHNGDMTLTPYSCTVSIELGGAIV